MSKENGLLWGWLVAALPARGAIGWAWLALIIFTICKSLSFTKQWQLQLYLWCRIPTSTLQLQQQFGAVLCPLWGEASGFVPVGACLLLLLEDSHTSLGFYIIFTLQVSSCRHAASANPRIHAF